MSTTAVADGPVVLPYWNLQIDGHDGCWTWAAGKDAAGYGRTKIRGRQRVAHRVFYEHIVGTVPDGLELDHLCRNRACCNPSHLEPVTHAENVRRGRAGAHIRARTACPAGHAYDDANTYVTPQGHRACRQCNLAAAERYRARRRERRSA